MSKHPNAWPCDIGTTRGTGLESVEAHIDAQHVYRNTHRVTLQEVEPWQLPTITRQVADERAASAQWHAQHNSAEGCADTGDDDLPRRPMTPTEAVALVLVMLLSGVAVLSAALVLWGRL